MSSDRRSSWVGVAVLIAFGCAVGAVLVSCHSDRVTGINQGPLDPALVAQGKSIFRLDTYGDETFWTDTLLLHQVIQSSVSPKTALSVGLKVDVDTLPESVKSALQAGQVNLDDPATTVTLLKLGAVVGVIGKVDASNNLTSVGITCAFCHSTVDNSFAPGIGHRLDGWPNRDLNVGAIVALSPVLPASAKAVYNSWGPGRYDPRFNFDGQNMPVMIPPAFGLRHVAKEIYTGDDTISYWNKYVAVTQMHGHGSFAPGIGHRLDGWPNRDLNVGAIVALSPVLPASAKAVYNSWGPGRYDPRFNFDGQNMPVIIPPAFGLRHVAKEIYTGDDTISYWNKYVAVTQMHGHGSFADPRISVSVNNPPENVTTAKLAALREYQFSLTTPTSPAGLDPAAVARGQTVFRGAGKCASCHVSDTLSDVNNGKLHTPTEVGQSAAYAQRSATKLYRTTPLHGLYHPPQLQGPYFHDGSAATLDDVVNHYVTVLGLTLTAQQKADLVAYLKSL